MVDFKLSDERRQYIQLAREFAQKEICPKASLYDHAGEFPASICQKAFDVGLMNVFIPEDYGGLGLGLIDACLIAEELACACSGVTLAIEANDLAQMPLICFGTHEQKKEFLAPMMEGLSYAGFGLWQWDSSGCLTNVKVVARRVGNQFVLNGDNLLLVNAKVANWFLIVAIADTQGDKQGYSAFLVPAQTKGIEIAQEKFNLGQRCADIRRLSFHDVCISEKLLLGREGQGLDIARMSWAGSQPIMAQWAIGLARSALAHSLTYSKERTTFGQPIANHQAVSFMLADMAKDIEAARLLVKESAWLYDQGLPNAKEASIAKSFSFDMAMRVAQDAVQIFGGYGYSREYPVEKLMRDAKNLQVYGLSSQIERSIIGKQLVGVL